MTERLLPELLQLIEASPDEPLLSHRIVDAAQAGIITGAEARHLQSFERRSPKSRKRALADSVDVTPDAVAQTRAKLVAVGEELRKRYPRGGDVR